MRLFLVWVFVTLSSYVQAQFKLKHNVSISTSYKYLNNWDYYKSILNSQTLEYSLSMYKGFGIYVGASAINNSFYRFTKLNNYIIDNGFRNLPNLCDITDLEIDNIIKNNHLLSRGKSKYIDYGINYHLIFNDKIKTLLSINACITKMYAENRYLSYLYINRIPPKDIIIDSESRKENYNGYKIGVKYGYYVFRERINVFAKYDYRKIIHFKTEHDIGLGIGVTF